jgi:hypothetical protein
MIAALVFGLGFFVFELGTLNLASVRYQSTAQAQGPKAKDQISIRRTRSSVG